MSSVLPGMLGWKTVALGKIELSSLTCADMTKNLTAHMDRSLYQHLYLESTLQENFQRYGPACCGSLAKTRDPCEPCKVTVIITLPMSTTDFTASKQDTFKTSLADVAGVTAATVSIDRILPSHGVGTPIIQVHASISVADMSAAASITQSVDNLALSSSLFDGLQVNNGFYFPFQYHLNYE